MLFHHSSMSIFNNEVDHNLAICTPIQGKRDHRDNFQEVLCPAQNEGALRRQILPIDQRSLRLPRRVGDEICAEIVGDRSLCRTNQTLGIQI